MASHDPADAICQRMAELRRELTGDVHEVRAGARAMTDWTFYVRRFPWAAAAAAALAGYMLVPAKKEVISPDPAALAEMAKKRQLWVETATSNKQTPGMFNKLLALGLTWAARTGMDYLGQRLRSPAAAAGNQPRRPVPTPGPVI